jgi:hypothetical protein
MVNIKLTGNKMREIVIPINYETYLEKSNQPDCRRAWINWKMDIYGMSEREATKAAYDPEWGYEKL